MKQAFLIAMSMLPALVIAVGCEGSRTPTASSPAAVDDPSGLVKAKAGD